MVNVTKKNQFDPTLCFVITRRESFVAVLRLRLSMIHPILTNRLLGFIEVSNGGILFYAIVKLCINNWVFCSIYFPPNNYITWHERETVHKTYGNREYLRTITFFFLLSGSLLSQTMCVYIFVHLKLIFLVTSSCLEHFSSFNRNERFIVNMLSGNLNQKNLIPVLTFTSILQGCNELVTFHYFC